MRSRVEISMRRIVVAVVACILTIDMAAADVTWLGGLGPPFLFVAGGAGAQRPGDTLTVGLGVGGRYEEDPIARFHLSIPAGLKLLYGDTANAGLLSAIGGNYTLKLLPRDPGRFEITGTFRVEVGNQSDEAAFKMPVIVRPDTVIVEETYYTLLETKREGQRYRYGRWWLIPLDSTETSVVEADIEQRGVRAQPAAPIHAVCRGCGAGTGVDSVHFVVIIARDGKVRDSRLLGYPEHDERGPGPAVVAAAREALRTSVFQAARAKGTAVSDWLNVTIPVRREP